MTKATLEAKIQELLIADKSVDAVVGYLESQLEWRQLSRADVESLCSFLTQAGYHGLLTKLLATNAQAITHFPWPQFADALFKATSNVPIELKNLILSGAAEDNSLEELSKSFALDDWDSAVVSARTNRKNKLKLKEIEVRTDYMQQVELLRIQGLFEQEEKVLHRLLRLFPGDEEIYSLLLNCRERRALDALSRRTTNKTRSRPVEKKDPNDDLILQAIEESQHLHLSQWPQLAIDFAISHWMWDNPEAGLRFLDPAPHSPSRDWLRLELLLKAKMFVAVLEEARILEGRYFDNPDSVMATLLYRAQALWGLGEKFQAMEILESVCASQPDFRSAAVILAEMKEDFE